LETDDLITARARDELGSRMPTEVATPGFPGEFDVARRFATSECAFAFDEDFDRLADHLAVELVRHLLLRCEQLVVAAALHVFRNIIGETIDRYCAGARRILEDEAVLEAAA